MQLVHAWLIAALAVAAFVSTLRRTGRAGAAARWRLFVAGWRSQMGAVTVEEYLSPADLAELLNVPRSTVYAWNYNGTSPPFVRVGKHVRYRRSDIDRWLEQQTTSGQPAA